MMATYKNDQFPSDCRTGSGCSPAPIGGASCTAAAAARRWNHDGATLLMSGGQDDKAIAILKLGLEHMKSKFRRVLVRVLLLNHHRYHYDHRWHSRTRKKNKKNHHRLAPAPCAFSYPHVSSSTSNCHVKMAPIPVYELRRYCVEDIFFVYSNALTFLQAHDHVGDHHRQSTTIITTMHTSAIEEEDKKSQEVQGRCINVSQMITSDLLSATIIYNLALAFHMRAIRESRQACSKCSNNKNTHLHAARRALALYDKCIQFLNQVINPAAVRSSVSSFQGDGEGPVLCSSTTARTISIPDLCLAIACRNNVVHLVYIQGDFEQWLTVTSSLKSLLGIYYSLLEVSDFVTPFLDSDLGGFNWNSILVTSPITAKAA